MRLDPAVLVNDVENLEGIDSGLVLVRVDASYQEIGQPVAALPSPPVGA